MATKKNSGKDNAQAMQMRTNSRKLKEGNDMLKELMKQH